MGAVGSFSDGSDATLSDGEGTGVSSGTHAQAPDLRGLTGGSVMGTTPSGKSATHTSSTKHTNPSRDSTRMSSDQQKKASRERSAESVSSGRSRSRSPHDTQQPSTVAKGATLPKVIEARSSADKSDLFAQVACTTSTSVGRSTSASKIQCPSSKTPESLDTTSESRRQASKHSENPKTSGKHSSSHGKGEKQHKKASEHQVQKEKHKEKSKVPDPVTKGKTVPPTPRNIDIDKEPQQERVVPSSKQWNS
ncbi:sericin-2-like [Ambystoma mexicanum]|uniref:sericin-2-like n=1 Tax=Ambystoma mexicanum TaxID=8296 RepID=UPI0037E80783